MESSASSRGTPQAVALDQIDTSADDRLPSGMGEMDRVLGGGLVRGSLVLLAGDPGVGKSTLVLRLAAELASPKRPCLYVAAEESAAQIRMRAERMGIGGEGLFVYAETAMDGALAEAERLRAGVMVVDSIQTVRADGLASAPGSVTQVRESTLRLLQYAKATHTPVLIVGHVTKEGMVAGPRLLEHIVDAVLYLEGDDHHAHRLLRSVKNRFGPTFEVAVFEMDGAGLREVTNPSAMLLAGRDASAPGSAVAVAMEGTRPLLVEIQALVAPTTYSLPRRLANGLDLNRLEHAAGGAGAQGRRWTVGARRLRQRGGRVAATRAGHRPGRGAGGGIQSQRSAAAPGGGGGGRGWAGRRTANGSLRSTTGRRSGAAGFHSLRGPGRRTNQRPSDHGRARGQSAAGPGRSAGVSADAVVLGAGSSARMGGTDKLLADLEGAPVIIWSLRAFEDCQGVRSVVVTTSKKNEELIREAVDQAGLSKVRAFVHGGASRAGSVLHGLRALDTEPPEYVAVHDGARPLVTAAMIEDGLRMARVYGAAVAAVPATDTLKIVDRERLVIRTPLRSSVWHAQTPQFARFPDLLGAHERQTAMLDLYTDDVSVLEAEGLPVRVFEGSRENLKITTPDDLDAAARIVRQRRAAAATQVG